MQVPNVEGVYRRAVVIGEAMVERFVIVTDREGAVWLRDLLDLDRDDGAAREIVAKLDTLLDIQARELGDLVP